MIQTETIKQIKDNITHTFPEPMFNSSPELDPKGWGHEILIHNDIDYCGKILHFKVGGESSVHFHQLKKETWYVHSGEFLVMWINLETGKLLSKNVVAGDIIDIPRYLPHRIHCLVEGDVFEVSTEHFYDDSYRVISGDSQKKI